VNVAYGSLLCTEQYILGLDCRPIGLSKTVAYSAATDYRVTNYAIGLGARS